MKAKCMILLLLACAWVLWRDMGDDVGGWWPASEHETLTQCQTAWLQAVDNMVEATAAKEVERRSKMGFIERFFTRSSVERKTSSYFKCMPAGTAPR